MLVALAHDCESAQTIICINHNEAGAIGMDRQGRLTECNVFSPADHITIINLAGTPIAWKFSAVPALIGIDQPHALDDAGAIFITYRTLMGVNTDCSSLMTGVQICPCGADDQRTPKKADYAQKLALAQKNRCGSPKQVKVSQFTSHGSS